MLFDNLCEDIFSNIYNSSIIHTHSHWDCVKINKIFHQLVVKSLTHASCKWWRWYPAIFFLEILPLSLFVKSTTMMILATSHSNCLICGLDVMIITTLHQRCSIYIAEESEKYKHKIETRYCHSIQFQTTW